MISNLKLSKEFQETETSSEISFIPRLTKIFKREIELKFCILVTSTVDLIECEEDASLTLYLFWRSLYSCLFLPGLYCQAEDDQVPQEDTGKQSCWSGCSSGQRQGEVHCYGHIILNTDLVINISFFLSSMPK